MKDKQSFLNIIFISVTLLTIFARNFPIHSTIRIAFTILSAILAIPYMFVLVKNKLYEKRLNIFVAILVVYQIVNIIYYTYILRV